jgi:hypothetical protein
MRERLRSKTFRVITAVLLLIALAAAARAQGQDLEVEALAPGAAATAAAEGDVDAAVVVRGDAPGVRVIVEGSEVAVGIVVAVCSTPPRSPPGRWSRAGSPRSTPPASRGCSSRACARRSCCSGR